jgi:uncharacterized protein (DUF885 family)
MRRRITLALALMLSLPAPAVAQAGNESAGEFARGYARIAAAKGREPEARRLHRLFGLRWRQQLADAPEFATYVGARGHDHRWSDLSLHAIGRRKQELREPLRVLRSIERARLGPADRLNYDLFRRGLEQAIEGAAFPEEYVPVTQLSGAQQDLARILALAPAATVGDYEAILARLHGVPEVVDQQIALMRLGLEKGVTPPRVTLRDVPAQVRAQTVDDPAASPLLRRFAVFPPAIPPADQERLRRAAAETYLSAVRPAFERLHAFVTDSYLPGARESIGMGTLPGGQAWYAFRARSFTTTDLTPHQIHELGLGEVKRIRGQMDSVITALGFAGDFAAFVHFLRTDPRFFHPDSATLIRSTRELMKRVDPELIRLFGKLPRTPYGVVPVPAYAARSQTTAYYEPGSYKAGRPGNYFVNWYDLKSRPIWEMEALSLHEAVPGHHLQIALADELENVPEFRKYGYLTAFVEGWGLYAESLGPELGMYRDPYSKFGQLTYEMWRAVRLVIDTGIHAMGWSREQAIEYFKANAAKTQHDIEVEVDRYIVDPGQALAYKIGELKLKELRALAAEELGDRFDVRAFHDQVLGNGPLPLDVLDRETRRWVARRRASQSASATRFPSDSSNSAQVATRPCTDAIRSTSSPSSRSRFAKCSAAGPAAGIGAPQPIPNRSAWNTSFSWGR